MFPNLTVRENLLMWTYRGGSETRRGRVARLRTVPEALTSAVSSSQALCRAASNRCWRSHGHSSAHRGCLLLDEISMGLAPLVVLELFEVVRQLAV